MYKGWLEQAQFVVIQTRHKPPKEYMSSSVPVLFSWKTLLYSFPFLFLWLKPMYVKLKFLWICQRKLGVLKKTYKGHSKTYLTKNIIDIRGTSPQRFFPQTKILPHAFCWKTYYLLLKGWHNRTKFSQFSVEYNFQKLYCNARVKQSVIITKSIPDDIS